MEGQSFTVSLEIANLTTPTRFSLSPLWDCLVITPAQVLASPGHTLLSLNLTAGQFYLYQVNISCSHNLSQVEAAIFEVPVSRTRTQTTIALVFARSVNVFLAFAMLLMGCELEWAVVRSYLARPLAPAAGMFCQFVVMPVMAYLVGLLLLSDRTVMARYGLIVVGSSPGGSFSNFWTGEGWWAVVDRTSVFLVISSALGRRPGPVSDLHLLQHCRQLRHHNILDLALREVRPPV